MKNKNRILSKIVLLSIMASSSLLATDKNIEFGVGYVKDNISGDIGVNGLLLDYSINDTDGADSDRFFGYAEVVNPIPFLPNLRVEYDNPSYSNGNLDLTISTKGGAYSGSSVGAYAIDFKEYSGFLYYDVADILMVDNVSFDIGIGAKYFDFDISATDIGNNFTFYQNSNDFVLPVIYLQPEISFSGFTAGLTFQGLGYDGTKFYEGKAALKYFFESSFGDIGIEFGYAYSKLELPEDSELIDDLSLDIEKSGFYTGLIYKW